MRTIYLTLNFLLIFYSKFLFAQNFSKNSKPEPSKIIGNDLQESTNTFKSSPIITSENPEFLDIEIQEELSADYKGDELINNMDIPSTNYELGIQNDNNNNNRSSAASISEPIVATGFDATVGRAKDSEMNNSIAISNSGKIISLTVIDARIYNTSGTLQLTKGLSSFFGSSGTVSGAKIIYDDAHDRFVAAGITDGGSTITIMTAKGSTLASWKKVKISGNLKQLDRTWGTVDTYLFNYLNIGFSREDIFITGQFLNRSNNIFGSIIYQISQSSLYSTTSSADYKTYWRSSREEGAPWFYSTIVPIKHGASGGYGPGIFLASLNTLHSNHFEIYDITADLADSPSLKIYKTESTYDVFFFKKTVSQKGSGTFLSYGDLAVYDGFYYNNKIYLVSLGFVNDDASNIVYTKINLSGGLRNGIGIDSKVISYSSGHLCFPTINPSNNFSDDQSVVCTFLASGETMYPSLMMCSISNTNTVSRITAIKNGNAAYSYGGYLEVGWGNYIGSCRRASDNSIWVSGSYCKWGLIYNKFHTRIAKIILPVNNASNRVNTPLDDVNKNPNTISSTTQKNDKKDIASILPNPAILNVDIFPNPTSDIFNISFELLSSKQTIKIRTIDITGKELNNHEHISLESGHYSYTVDASTLDKGLYYVIIEGASGVLAKKKLVVE